MQYIIHRSVLFESAAWFLNARLRNPPLLPDTHTRKPHTHPRPHLPPAVANSLPARAIGGGGGGGEENSSNSSSWSGTRSRARQAANGCAAASHAPSDWLAAPRAVNQAASAGLSSLPPRFQLLSWRPRRQPAVLVPPPGSDAGQIGDCARARARASPSLLLLLPPSLPPSFLLPAPREHVPKRFWLPARCAPTHTHTHTARPLRQAPAAQPKPREEKAVMGKSRLLLSQQPGFLQALRVPLRLSACRGAVRVAGPSSRRLPLLPAPPPHACSRKGHASNQHSPIALWRSRIRALVSGGCNRLRAPRHRAGLASK